MSCVLEARLRSNTTRGVADLNYAAHQLVMHPDSDKWRAKVAKAKEINANLVTLTALHTAECETCFNALNDVA